MARLPPAIDLVYSKRDILPINLSCDGQRLLELKEAELVGVLSMEVDYDEVAQPVLEVDVRCRDLPVEHAIQVFADDDQAVAASRAGLLPRAPVQGTCGRIVDHAGIFEEVVQYILALVVVHIVLPHLQ